MCCEEVRSRFGTLRHKPSKANHMPNETSASLRDIAALFLKLGIIGFGGPAAHIAMMRQEVVEKRFRRLSRRGECRFRSSDCSCLLPDGPGIPRGWARGNHCGHLTRSCIWVPSPQQRFHRGPGGRPGVAAHPGWLSGCPKRALKKEKRAFLSVRPVGKSSFPYLWSSASYWVTRLFGIAVCI